MSLKQRVCACFVLLLVRDVIGFTNKIKYVDSSFYICLHFTLVG